MAPVLEPVPRPLKTAAAFRPAMLWHLLSLDAPTVATLWTGFIGRTVHVPLPASSLAAMFLAVWILYVADRLLDARHLEGQYPLDRHAMPDMEARHFFHFRHRRAYTTGLVLASLALGPLLLALPAEAIRLYLGVGSLLFAWFVLIHIVPVKSPQRLPKEFAVGAFFAAATFIPTVSRAPSLRPILLLPALLFAVLCSLNCLYIYAWEHAPASRSICHPTTRVALAHLPVITAFFLLAAFAAAVFDRAAWRLTFAIALSTLILAALDRLRPLPRTGLRVAADLALLTPILFLL